MKKPEEIIPSLPEDIETRRRSRELLKISGIVLMAIGLGWTLFFAKRQAWFIASLELGLALSGVVVFLLARARHYRWAAAILYTCLFVTLSAFALFLDLPSAAAPRAAHIYLLAIGISAFYVFRYERRWVRIAVCMTFLAGFVFFSGSHVGIPNPYTVPDEVRVMGSYINSILAMGVVVLTFYLMHAEQTERSNFVLTMRDALAARHFHLHYQPQVDEQGGVIGAEALMRWTDPKRGQVPPTTFIPVAEQSGFVLALGEWALHEACLQLARWQQDDKARHLSLSVNVSAIQFKQPDFIEHVLRTLQETGAPASKLKLELTESMVVNDIDKLVATMQTLIKHGVQFSLDDFGTGFSSLNHLGKLPVRQLKIDQSFVRGVHQNANASTIATSLISLGTSLGMTVIAEGVETEDELAYLKRRGCKFYQGFLFSHALPAQEFDRYLVDHRIAQTQEN